MAKKKINLMQIIAIACLALMVALIVTQFLPYWTFGKDNTTVSISDYVWFPNTKAYKSFLTDMKAQLVAAGLLAKEVKLVINDFAYPPALLALISLFGFIFCPFKLGKPLGIAFNLAAGGLGIWLFTCHPIYQLGQNWLVGLILSIALTALAVLNAVLYIVKKLKD